MYANLFFSVGMARFELATPRPPDVYSNRTELHPENFFLRRCKDKQNGGSCNSGIQKIVAFWQMELSQFSIRKSRFTEKI